MRELERFDGTRISLAQNNSDTGIAPLSMFVAAEPLPDIVRSVLSAADAAASAHYTATPRGQPWPERVAAGTAALQSRTRSIAHTGLRNGAPRVITNRNQFWQNHGAALAARFLLPRRPSKKL